MMVAIRSVLLMMLITVFWVGESWAKEVVPRAPKAVTLGAVKVTAGKTTETLQEVPQSITVLDEGALEERRITGVKEIIQQIPNMYTVHGISKTESSVRGLNASVHSFSNPVVLYMDGIPIVNRYGYDLPLIDVERIEVLRGPQGTLYGKDAIGGIIKVVTQTPGDVWKGKLNTELGNYRTRNISCAANGPIVSDLLYAGIWGAMKYNGGWIENEHLDSSRTANDDGEKRIGANLRLNPTDHFNVSLHVMHEDYHTGFANGGMITGPFNPGTGFFSPPSISEFNNAHRSDFRHANYDKDTYQDTVIDSQALRLEYNTNQGVFESITTHRVTDVDGRWDVDYGYISPPAGGHGIFNNQAYYDVLKGEVLSQELRWSHKLDSGLRWVTGVYFEKENIDVDNFAIQFFNTDYRFVSQNESMSQAVFGQLTVPFWSDFELTLGGRYQHIEKEIDLKYYETAGVNSGISLGAPKTQLKASKIWNTFLPKAALSYRINDDWTTYASVALGYMPGGFNYATSSSNADDAKFKPQKSWSYEIGTKASLLDDNLFLSAAAFYMNIEDIHVFSIQKNISVTSNAAKAISCGLEVEADYRISQCWRINAALGVIHTKYEDYIDKNRNNNSGNRIERTPSHSINLGLQYTHPTGFYGRADLINYGKVYFDAANTLYQDAYVLVNLKAGYMSKKLDIYAYGNNVTNTDYKTFGQTGAPAGILVEFGDPLEFGIGVNYHF